MSLEWWELSFDTHDSTSASDKYCWKVPLGMVHKIDLQRIQSEWQLHGYQTAANRTLNWFFIQHLCRDHSKSKLEMVHNFYHKTNIQKLKFVFYFQVAVSSILWPKFCHHWTKIIWKNYDSFYATKVEFRSTIRSPLTVNMPKSFYPDSNRWFPRTSFYVLIRIWKVSTKIMDLSIFLMSLTFPNLNFPPNWLFLNAF